tara:strand:+ start:423 stop:1139 length:717 start_codon:yes stop_codon:yes gene_type:complete
MGLATTVPFPEQTIKTLLETGIATIVADPTLLDGIWTGLDPADLTRLKSVWATNPPTVVSGFAREGAPFPLFAITLAGDNPNADYLGLGEHWVDLDDDDVFDSGELTGVVRTTGSFGVYVYAHHADVCAAYYRVARFVFNVGRKALIQAGLQEPQMTGVELRPDARYTPDNLYVRQLTLTVEYEERWPMEGTMSTALGIAPPARLTDSGLVEILHEDQYPGDTDKGVQPYSTEPEGNA